MRRYQFSREAVRSGQKEEINRIPARQQQFLGEVRRGEAELLTPKRVLDAEALRCMDGCRPWAASFERRHPAEMV